MRHMLFVLLFTVSCSACVDLDSGELPQTAGSGSPPVIAPVIEPGIEPGDLVTPSTPCAGTCFNIYANVANIPSLRPDGQPWDPDGSLPEPYMTISINGQQVGSTTVIADLSQMLFYPDFSAYRAYWGQIAATVSLKFGDVISMNVFDADQHYAILDCGFALSANTFTPPCSVVCFREIGMVGVGFEAAP